MCMWVCCRSTNRAEIGVQDVKCGIRLTCEISACAPVDDVGTVRWVETPMPDSIRR